MAGMIQTEEVARVLRVAGVSFVLAARHHRQAVRAVKLQDAADFTRIIDANAKIRIPKLESLAELGYPVTPGQGLGAAQTVFGSVKPASAGAAPAPAHSVRVS